MKLTNNQGQTAIIGAGSWGTALALLLAKKGIPVRLWGHRAEHVVSLAQEKENRRFLPGFSFPDNLIPVSDLRDAVTSCQNICMVVPSHAFRAVFERVLPHLAPGCCLITATKGIENETLLSMTQIMQQVIEQDRSPSIHMAVLSGPSFAREVAAGVPTAITIGSHDLQVAQNLQALFNSKNFRVYASTDVIGLEISAALKNVVAIAAGICDGLQYGSNARAALITRGLAEIARLGEKLGADRQTFYGLSGLGDLVLTCTGDLSRNRTVGRKLGEGKKLAEILAGMAMVAEGVKTTRSGRDLARKMGVEMPILDQVYKILYEDKSCRTAVDDLLSRELKQE